MWLRFGRWQRGSIRRARLPRNECLEAGITRRGKAVAHLSPAVGPKMPLPLGELARFRASMPFLRRPAADLLRGARDEGL